MNKIKRIIVNIMVTTGSALMLLAFFAVIIGSKTVYVHTFFEILGANIVIHCGYIFVKKFESTYAVLEFFLDFSYLVVVLVVFALIFDWFSSIPVWYLVIMAIVIYAFGFFINIVRMKKDADELNELLQKHKNKNTNTVT
jgi:hypothetical protein